MIELDIELLLWIINVYDSGHTIERSRSNEKLLNVGAVSVGQRHSHLVPTQPTSYRSRFAGVRAPSVRWHQKHSVLLGEAAGRGRVCYWKLLNDVVMTSLRRLQNNVEKLTVHLSKNYDLTC